MHSVPFLFPFIKYDCELVCTTFLKSSFSIFSAPTSLPFLSNKKEEKISTEIKRRKNWAHLSSHLSFVFYQFEENNRVAMWFATLNLHVCGQCAMPDTQQHYLLHDHPTAWFFMARGYFKSFPKVLLSMNSAARRVGFQKALNFNSVLNLIFCTHWRTMCWGWRKDKSGDNCDDHTQPL